MTDGVRKVEGTILKLRCSICGYLFHHFLFSGDEDVDTIGLCSASSCKNDNLALVEAGPNEWKDFSDSGYRSIERRLTESLDCKDFKVIRALRVDDKQKATAGLSFAEFKKIYTPPVIVYSCPCCDGGESRLVEEIAVDDFQSSGGKIILTGRLNF